MQQLYHRPGCNAVGHFVVKSIPHIRFQVRRISKINDNT
jgi:hypothetical protein